MAVLKNAIALLRLSMGSSVRRNFGTAKPESSYGNIIEMSRFVVVEELLKTIDYTETNDWCRLEVSYMC
ncbi:hypothetical protein Tco_0812217 [Tanacetum coccineum]